MSRPLASLLAGLVLASFLGWTFEAARVPLGWILGAMLGGALVTNLIARPVLMSPVRRGSQLLIGTAAAVVMTPDVLQTMLGLLPAMIATTLFANMVGAAMILPFARLTGVDRTTAALSVLPAGMAEMSSLAQDLGARSEVVVVTHTLRVVLVVLSIPVLLQLTATPLPDTDPVPGASHGALLTCIGLGAALAYVAGRLGILNAWILMPMIAGVALVALGFPLMPLPDIVLIAAQVGIGLALGTRLLASDLVRLPRIALAATLSGLILILAMLFGAVPMLSQVVDVDTISLSLSAAPGGLGEMIATSKAIGGATAIVAAFQFVRSFLTNILVPPIILRFLR